MFLSEARHWVQRKSSVRDDWLARLPEQKRRLFDAVVAELEAAYAMLSVALNEALALRSTGALVRARQQAAVTPDLFDRLAARTLAALTALENHARHFGTLPAVSALNPSFFRGETAQRSAAWNNLLHRILLGSRARFFHKLRSLSDMVEELAQAFREASEEIAEGACVHPRSRWEELECLHYDLNTCLRETMVMLKSFLRVLPAEELEAFQRKLEALTLLAPQRTRARFSRAST